MDRTICIGASKNLLWASRFLTHFTDWASEKTHWNHEKHRIQCSNHLIKALGEGEGMNLSDRWQRLSEVVRVCESCDWCSKAKGRCNQPNYENQSENRSTQEYEQVVHILLVYISRLIIGHQLKVTAEHTFQPQALCLKDSGGCWPGCRLRLRYSENGSFLIQRRCVALILLLGPRQPTLRRGSARARI